MMFAARWGWALGIVTLSLLPTRGWAQEGVPLSEAPDWDAFADSRRAECDGPRGVLAKPVELTAGGHRYRVEGHRLVQLDHDADRLLRIGVISAIKDDREETVAAVKALLARFRKAKIDVLIANGDLSTNEFQMENVFPLLASAEVLVVATIGNTESCGSFNRAANDVFKKYPNFINGNWVRRLELDDATLLTLPGYYNRPFVHTGGAAVYNEDDLDELRRIAEDAPPPLVLVSHGPPLMKGKKALDLAIDAGNVGDPLMAEFLKSMKISFGISGHILEAGGRGTDLSGMKVRPAKRWHPSLYVNAGTANPDPWGMLNGSTSYGMGLYVEIAGAKARFQVEKLPRP